MQHYLLKRFLFIIPTLLGVMLTNFLIIQTAPGGPVEQALAELKGQGSSIEGRFTGNNNIEAQSSSSQAGDVQYRGSQGLDAEFIAQLNVQYGFDQPMWKRFVTMLGDYVRFDFGTSYFQDRSVLSLLLDKLPVSISLGLWTTLLVYLISIPLGIKKAVRDGSSFDVWSSAVVVVGNAVPAFLFAILLIVLFAGGSFWQLFPLKGLVSSHWAELGFWAKIGDYFWHLALPLFAMVIGGFAGLTLLTKNSFLDHLQQQYVTTAIAKGNSERGVLYKHVFRNAMLIVVAGFPAAFIGILFTSSLLIEIIFSLDGLGSLGFDAMIRRDYPVMFGTLYLFTLIGLLLNIMGDVMYVLIDPRIDFNKAG